METAIYHCTTQKRELDFVAIMDTEAKKLRAMIESGSTHIGDPQEAEIKVKFEYKPAKALAKESSDE